MNLNIYDKESMQIIARPVITSLEDFKTNPEQFYPDFDSSAHVISEVEILNPILDNGNLREMSKDELYKAGKYTLAEKELVEDGKIKSIELSECEYIENNQIKLKRDTKIEHIEKELSKLKTEHSEKEFVFKENYVQKNRELDKNNLNSIVTMMMFTKQAKFEGWKIKDKQDNDVFLTLTAQDIISLADIMTKQTTKAMHVESELRAKLETLSDEDLKNYDSKKEFEELWKK